MYLYLGRHSPGSGCAGIHCYNGVPNCRCPSSTVLRPGYPYRHPVPVPPSEAEDFGSAEAGKILLERGHPRFELATTLLAPVGWRLRVNDLANDFAGRTSHSMPEPTKSTLKKHRRQNSKVKSMTKCDTRDTILTTASLDEMETVIVEDLHATLILYAQRPGLATVKQDRPNH